jgi:hypothetical protein
MRQRETVFTSGLEKSATADSDSNQFQFQFQ